MAYVAPNIAAVNCESEPAWACSTLSGAKGGGEERQDEEGARIGVCGLRDFIFESQRQTATESRDLNERWTESLVWRNPYADKTMMKPW